MSAAADARAAILQVAGNLSATHHEHEKHYGEAPLAAAATLLRYSRTLKALAEHWQTAEPASDPLPSPLAGATDINDTRAIETTGVLWMESGDVPAEIGTLLADLERFATDAEATSQYLTRAMDAAWGMAAGLLAFPELDDLLAERHGIIARDAQTGALLGVQARQLRRAAEILQHADLTVAGLRADLAGERRASRLLFAAAEMIDAAADNCLAGAELIRHNERAWRLFAERTAEIASRDGP